MPSCVRTNESVPSAPTSSGVSKLRRPSGVSICARQPSASGSNAPDVAGASRVSRRAFVEPAQQRGTEFARRQRPAQRVDALLAASMRTLPNSPARLTWICRIGVACAAACRHTPIASSPLTVARGQRQVAFVVAGLGVGARRGGFDQGGGDAGRIQRDRQAGADQAAADDQDTGFVRDGGTGTFMRR